MAFGRTWSGRKQVLIVIFSKLNLVNFLLILYQSYFTVQAVNQLVKLIWLKASRTKTWIQMVSHLASFSACFCEHLVANVAKYARFRERICHLFLHNSMSLLSHRSFLMLFFIFHSSLWRLSVKHTTLPLPPYHVTTGVQLPVLAISFGWPLEQPCWLLVPAHTIRTHRFVFVYSMNHLPYLDAHFLIALTIMPLARIHVQSRVYVFTHTATAYCNRQTNPSVYICKPHQQYSSTGKVMKKYCIFLFFPFPSSHLLTISFLSLI